jgi:hypothetical protein
MGRKTRSKNCYSPLSESFCNSILKKNKKSSDMFEKLHKTEKIAESKSGNISKINTSNAIVKGTVRRDNGGRTFLNSDTISATAEKIIKGGYVREYKIRNGNDIFIVSCEEDRLHQFVEMMHFGFSINNLTHFLNIKPETLTLPKGIKSIEALWNILLAVPLSYKKYEEIITYIPDLKEEMDKYAKSPNKLAQKWEVSVKKVNIISSIVFDYIAANSVSEEQIEENVVKTEEVIDTTVDRNDTNIITNQVETNLKDEDKVVLASTSDNILRNIKENGFKYLLKCIDIQEYIKLFDINDFQLPCDIDKNVDNYILNAETDSEKVIYYAYKWINDIHNYSRPFYPIEDRILEMYYKDFGIRCVEIIRAVMPNFVERPDSEYLERVMERGYKTPHPMNSFELSEMDILFISILYPLVIKSPTKYFPMYDNFDLQYFAMTEGIISDITTKKVKELKTLKYIDLKPYIDSAFKLKEYLYHSEKWTSYNHDIFKEYFKSVGLKISEVLIGITESDCQNHSLTYKIYQNYTTVEVDKMKEVYFSEGFEGLMSKFSYRTKEALEFKVKEQGWADELKNKQVNEVYRQELEIKLRSEIEEEMTRKYDSILKEAVERNKTIVLKNYEDMIKKEVKSEFMKNEVPKIEKSCIDKITKKSEEDKAKRERELQQIVLKTVRRVKSEIPRIINDTPFRKIVDELPKRVESVISSELVNGFKNMK